jgi:hypothetical protein
MRAVWLVSRHQHSRVIKLVVSDYDDQRTSPYPAQQDVSMAVLDHVDDHMVVEYGSDFLLADVTVGHLARHVATELERPSEPT